MENFHNTEPNPPVAIPSNCLRSRFVLKIYVCLLQNNTMIGGRSGADYSDVIFFFFYGNEGNMSKEGRNFASRGTHLLQEGLSADT